ncbi:MAG: alcohol dehydrogenase catalytic domain-containing protein [Acidimicrobiales bacterium]
MKALVVQSPGRVGLDDIAPPIVGADELLVQPVACGMCGTDLEIIDGTIDLDYVRYPLTLGHEWVGRLIGVNGHPVDGLVVVEGIVPCGHCDECLIGATNRCRTYDEIGFTRAGAIADLISVPEALVHHLDPSVSMLDAALVEPMAVVWRALTRTTIRPGATCLVIGDGTVGLLATHLLTRFAPASITVLGLRACQHDLALEAGASEFTTQLADKKFDVIIEAAGHIDAVATALKSVARGGSITLLGLPAHGSEVPIAPDDFVNNDITLRGSFSYTRTAWADVVNLLNAGELTPSFLVTHSFVIDDYEEALNALRHPSPGAPRGKVMMLLNDFLPGQ